jgi:hypothetical protein
MKNIFKIVLVFSLLITLVASCSTTKSLAELRKEESEAIANYISQNGIQVSPIDSAPKLDEQGLINYYAKILVPNKTYYHTTSGLYLHVDSAGGTGIAGAADTTKTGDIIVARYYEIDMSGDTTTFAMYPSEQTNPYIFQYNKGEACAAFNEVVRSLRNGGIADFIVPSAIGFSATAQQTITPYRYHMQIKIQH